MIISYPVLPSRQGDESEDAYLTRILDDHVLSADGGFPVSTIKTSKGPIHRWHGGVHIQGRGEPIRAMADGTVVAFRFAKEAETYEGLGRYDTSFVLIRHETQTGERTTVAYYSLYMHLANRGDLLPDRYQQLPTWLRSPACAPGPGVQKPANLKVWRKDVLGFAGKLYDSEACHIEVFTTDANLRAFWRDSTAITQGAGSEDFFGDAHFVIPANRDFSARHPRAAETGAHRIDLPGDADFGLPVGTAGQNTQPLYVSVRLDKGRRTATTFIANGQDGYTQLGAPVVQDNYDYELFRLASALYPDCPSAGLEWLRFGRVLGSDTTTRSENWQLVRYSETAMGYVDLAPNPIAKLSDADFVHWQGWEKRDEGQAANAGDGICDDERTITLCQGVDEASRIKTRHLICKAPSEWDAGDLDVRYGHLREVGMPLASDPAWQKFVDHVKKMAFWSEVGLSERSVWHFHPMQFVRHFRKSGWLSQSELLQLIPSSAMRNAGKKGWVSEAVPDGPAHDWISDHHADLNQSCLKFNITTPRRMAAFYANATQETQWLGKLHEYNDQARYWPWDGRGFLQLTWPDNYVTYWRFKGREISKTLASALSKAAKQANAEGSNEALRDGNVNGLTAQIRAWRTDVADNAPDAAHSAGAYWAWTQAARFADVPPQLERKSQLVVGSGAKPYYWCESFGQVAATVNFGSPRSDPSSINKVNGIVARFQSYSNALVVLDDRLTFKSSDGKVLMQPEGFVPRRPK